MLGCPAVLGDDPAARDGIGFRFLVLYAAVIVMCVSPAAHARARDRVFGSICGPILPQESSSLVDYSDHLLANLLWFLGLMVHPVFNTLLSLL